MKKKIRKLLSLFLLIAMSVTFIPSFQVSAETPVKINCLTYTAKSFMAQPSIVNAINQKLSINLNFINYSGDYSVPPYISPDAGVDRADVFKCGPNDPNLTVENGYTPLLIEDNIRFKKGEFPYLQNYLNEARAGYKAAYPETYAMDGNKFRAVPVRGEFMNTAWSYNYDHALYVNKALLNELNGGVMPETLDEMFDLAINAADAGHQGIGFQNSWWLNQFIAAYTNSFELIIKDGKLLPNFYDENMTPFLAKIAKLVNKSALYINADNVDNFKTGDMLFCLDGLGAWDTSDKLRPIQNVLPSADRMMMPEGPFGSVQISNTGSFLSGNIALNCLRDSGDETKNGKILELYNYLLSPEGLELQVFGVKGTDWDYNAAGNREYKAGISPSLGGMLNDFMQAFIHQHTGLAIARDNASLQALDYFYDRYNAGLNGTTTPFGIGITEEFNDNSPALYPYYGVRDNWINGILNGSLTVEDLPDMKTELYGDFYNDLVQQLSVVYDSKITSNTDVTGVEIDIKSVSIKVGVAPLQLTATVTPATALNRGVFWTSSDKSIATVDYTGKVTAIKQGEAVITATAIDGKSISQCNVVILPPFTLGSYKASSNNVITNVNPGTTTQEFNNQVLPVGTTTVFNAPLAPVGKVGTGATVDITLNSYTTTYTIKIYGDVSGDGAINLTDLTNIKQHLLKLTSLTGTFKDAGDISKKGSISISDLLAVKKDLLGISPINQNP